MNRLLARAVGLTRDLEVARARRARSAEEEALRSHLRADDERFRRAMLRHGEQDVLLGTDASGIGYHLAVPDLAGLFAWISAATGAGKSRLLGAILWQLVQLVVFAGLGAVILFDMKGELSDLLLRQVAAYAATLSPEARCELVSRLIVLRFFTGPYLVEWNLFARDPSVPIAAQAHAWAETLEATQGHELGLRQSPATTLTTALGIEAGRTPLEWRYLLYNPAELAAIAERSSLPEARVYVATRMARERAAIDGVAARLDGLLRVEPIKAALAGPGMLDLRRCFQPGTLTVCDLGTGVPLGAESQKKGLAAPTLTRLVWAGFDTHGSRSGFTVIAADELQEAILPATARHIQRVVTTGRSYGLGFWSCHQSAAQLPAELQAILSTNVRLRILGRSGEDDARRAVEWLPKTGLVPKPRLPGIPAPEGPALMSEGEELRHRIAEIGRLPARTFLVADRSAPFGPRLVRAPDFSPPQWDEIDPEVTDAVLRGSVGQPREELVRRAREIEERAAAAVLSQAPSSAPARARRTARELPDVVTRAGRRGRTDAPAPLLPDVVSRTSRRRAGGDVP